MDERRPVVTALSAASAYQLYQILNVHVSHTDLEVEILLPLKIKRPPTRQEVDAILKEHHAAQQLVRDLRL